MARAPQKNKISDITPPADPAAEQSLLGAILLRPSVLDKVADLLEAGDFCREAHGRIFRTMMELYQKQEPVDMVTVSTLLRERRQLEEVGGPLFLTGLSEHVGIAANASYYARIVWQKSQIRKLQAKAAQILNESPNGNLEEYFTWAESQILEITTPALDRSRANSFPPLISTITPISECLKNPPPARNFLFNGNLPAEIVGGLIAIGGTGKGHALIMLGLCLATDKEAGPLKPTGKFKTVYLAGEDSQEELNRRTIAAKEALWPDGSPPPEIDNFIPVSVMGQLGPLMKRDAAGNPIINIPAYDWLCKTLANLPDVEVLILDPKSKFYGLDENDNTHCAAWVNCLESLVSRFNITVLFSHHESKARAASMEQTSSRGGSALTDGCRWVANIKTMDPKTAEKFQVADPHNYVVLDVTKSNYAPKLPAPVYFRRGPGGALSYVNLGAERIQEIADRLLNRLAEEEAVGHQFSRRDLLYGKRAKLIIDDLKEAIQGFNRIRDLNWVLDHLLQDGLLEEIRVKGKTGPEKTILRVVTITG